MRLDMDLNQIVQAPPRAAACCDPNTEVIAVTRNCIATLVEQIRLPEVTHVVGCVAWMTHPDILRALSEKRGVSIIVQKEDFFRREPGARHSLRNAYDALLGLRLLDMPNCPDDFADIGVTKDDRYPAVRCFGVKTEDDFGLPRMHHKFLVLCATEASQRSPVPKAVATGSLNLTKNAGRSLENLVLILSHKIASHYTFEWLNVLGHSEPLDWTKATPGKDWSDCR